VGIGSALNALILSNRASRERFGCGGEGTVIIDLAVGSGYAVITPVGITSGVLGLVGSSPLSNGTIAVSETLNTATTFKLTSGVTRVSAISISDTEIHTNTSEGIAVGVRERSARRTINVGATALREVGSQSAILARSIPHAVGIGSRAIRVGFTSATNTIASTSRLKGDETTIVGLTLGIGLTVGAATILKAVLVGVVTIVLLTANVVSVCSSNPTVGAEPGVDANS
jgi:hypothetical protein